MKGEQVTTEQIEIVSDEAVDENVYDPERLCHLYRSTDPPATAVCGWIGRTHKPEPWNPGQVTCSCGNPACMDCLLAVS